MWTRAGGSFSSHASRPAIQTDPPPASVVRAAWISSIGSKGRSGNRTSHRMHPHLTVSLVGAARGTVARECGEHFDHIVVVLGRVAHDVLQGVRPADTDI